MNHIEVDYELIFMENRAKKINFTSICLKFNNMNPKSLNKRESGSFYIYTNIYLGSTILLATLKKLNTCIK